MKNERHNDEIDETADALVFGLLSEDDAAKARARAASDPAMRAAIARAKARRETLLGLPGAEPSSELIAAAMQARESGAVRVERWHRRRVLFAGSLGGMIAAAALAIVAIQMWVASWTPPGLAVQLVAQSEVNAGSRGSLRVVVESIAGQKPLSGRDVSLLLRKSNGASTTLAAFTTDANGTASPSFMYPDWEPGNYTLSVEVDGYTHLERTVALKRERRVMLSTDKPQYQPGQTIHLRTLALTRGSGLPAVAETATFTIVDPGGNTIFRKSGKTSAFGIASADCELATEIREGPYAIRAETGTTVSTRTVEVKRYVLPKFKVAVELDGAYYAPGAKIKGRIDAWYFFGKPVHGSAEVAVRPIGLAIDEIRPPAVKLDADGRGEFEVTLPRKLFGREQDSGDARVEVVVKVRDTAGQEITRVVSRVVTAKSLRMEVVPECATLVVGVPQNIHVFVTTPDGTPIAADVGIGNGKGIRASDQGLATIEWTPGSESETLDVWAKAGKSEVRRKVSVNSVRQGFVLRTDAGSYDAGGTMVITAIGGGVQPVFVDLIKDGQTISTVTIDMIDGKGALTVDLPVELSGAVLVEAYRFDPIGLPVRTSRAVFVRPVRDVRVSVAPDKPEHRPGDSTSLSFTLTAADGKPTAGAVSLAVVDEAALNVMTERPGMERSFFLLEDELLKPAAVLYGHDWLSPGVRDDAARSLAGAAMSRASSRGIDPGERIRLEGLGEEPRDRVWQYMEGGWGRLSASEFAPPGVKGLLASSHQEAFDRFRSSQHRAEARIRTAWVYVVIGGIVVGLVCIGMFAERPVLAVVGTVVVIVFVGGLLLPALGKARASSRGVATMAAPAGGEARGLRMDDRLRMYAGAPPTMLAADAAGGESLQPTRVREWFPETLVWAPEIIADENGRASISFDLADSITNWKAMGSAVTAGGGLGSFDADLRVFQPFFVDVNAPVALVQNDTIDLPLVVYNYLETTQRVKLDAEVGDWCELLSEPDFELDLKPGEVRSVGLRLRATKVGSHALRINASAGAFADAVRRSIDVVPDGVPVEQVVSGVLDDELVADVGLPPGAIAGSERLLVRIFPSAFSEVLGGLEGILAMPHGCFEQTSSTTYPNVLALDYMKSTKRASPEVEAKARQYIHLGYQRLLTFEVQGGGFDWFGRPPANVVLTAYGLMEFEDMARVHDVDAALLDRTRNWLLAKRGQNGVWSADREMLNDGLAGSVRRGGDLDLATTAYVAWAVFGNGKATDQAPATLEWLLAREPSTIDNPHTLALVCNALLAISPKDAQPYLARLVSLANRSDDGKSANWSVATEARTTFYGRGESASIETTSLAVLALLKTKGEAPLCRAAMTWLVGQRDPRGSWHTTQATVLALKALLAGASTAAGKEGTREFRVTVDGGEPRVIRVPEDQSDVVQFVDLSTELRAGAARVRVEDRSGSGCTAQVTVRSFVPRPDEPSPESSLGIEVAYERSQLKVGDAMGATATVRNRAAEAAPMVMVDLPVPAGFTPELDAFDAMVAKGAIARYEVTPRSVIVYLTGIPAGGTVRMQYELRATMPVDVTAPGAAVWEYYNPANRGVGRSSRVKSV